MGASCLLETLDIMFTVIAIGLVVITATFIDQQYHSNIPVFNVLAACWAFGLIVAKRVDNKQMFSRAAIMHLVEIVTILKMLHKLMVLRRDGESLQGMQLQDSLWEVIGLARPSAPFLLVGLAITGYGMVIVFFAGGSPSVFFLGDFGVYFIIIGLIVIIARSERARAQHDKNGLRAGGSLLVYILVLLVATSLRNNRICSD